MRSSLAGIALLLAVIRPGSAADDATLLDVTGAGIVAVNAETLLQVRAVEGEISIRPGVAGELQFQSTSIDKEGEEVPVALWTDGGAFRIEPPEGQATVRTRLSLSIPAGTGVRLDLEDAAVNADGLDGNLAVHGRKIRLQASRLLQSAEIEIEGGGVSVKNAAKGVTIVGRDLDVALDNVAGPASLRLNGGTAKLSGLLSGLGGNFTGTGVTIDAISGTVTLRFLKGSARIAGLRDGGEMTLSGCPLRLEKVAGAISIASDSEVKFSDCQASIRVENSAGAVKGISNEGALEVTTYRAEVALAHVGGQLRISGDELDVKLENIRAALGVFTRSSKVSLEGASAAVTVENDLGDVTIKRAAGEVEIKTRYGDVRLQEMQGPVTVQADGAHVEVEWTVVSTGKDSRITNEGGDVTVRFPAAGGCKVDAKSRIGRIDSDLPKVAVHEEGGSAQGIVGNGGPKTVFIEASGDVHLLGAGVPEQSGQAP